MNDSVTIPKWFWIVGVVLLLWGAMGIFSFYSELTMSREQLVAAMGETVADRYAMMPHWIWWVFGIAVWSATFGSIALLLRRNWARPLYLVSLVAVIIQFGYIFAILKVQEVQGWGAAAFPACIIAVGIVELWFADWANKKGWLK